MSAMILSCGACSAQNFISAERRAAAHAPPVCWKCGAALAIPDETAAAAQDSKNSGKKQAGTGGERNA